MNIPPSLENFRRFICVSRAFRIKTILAGLVLLNLCAIAPVNGQPAPAAPIAEIPPPNTTNWTCVPPDFMRGPKRDLAVAGKESRRMDWVRPPITLNELTAGLRMVKDPAKPDLLLWEKLHCFPTICTEAVPEDWTGYQLIEFKLTSAAATGDRLSIGVLADNPQTGYQDFFCKDFNVDWTGAKTLSASRASSFPSSQLKLKSHRPQRKKLSLLPGFPIPGRHRMP